MEQVFEQSNKETIEGEDSKTTTNQVDNWDAALLEGDPETDSKTEYPQTVNILYMLSSLGFVTFKDFEDHFSTCFLELNTPKQVTVFKTNFFVLLAAIQQICLQSYTDKPNEMLGSMRFNSFIEKCNVSKIHAGPSFFETNSNQISVGPFV